MEDQETMAGDERGETIEETPVVEGVGGDRTDAHVRLFAAQNFADVGFKKALEKGLSGANPAQDTCDPSRPSQSSVLAVVARNPTVFAGLTTPLLLTTPRVSFTMNSFASKSMPASPLPSEARRPISDETLSSRRRRRSENIHDRCRHAWKNAPHISLCLTKNLHTQQRELEIRCGFGGKTHLTCIELRRLLFWMVLLFGLIVPSNALRLGCVGMAHTTQADAPISRMKPASMMHSHPKFYVSTLSIASSALMDSDNLTSGMRALSSPPIDDKGLGSSDDNWTDSAFNHAGSSGRDTFVEEVSGMMLQALGAPAVDANSGANIISHAVSGMKEGVTVGYCATILSRACVSIVIHAGMQKVMALAAMVPIISTALPPP